MVVAWRCTATHRTDDEVTLVNGFHFQAPIPPRCTPVWCVFCAQRKDWYANRSAPAAKTALPSQCCDTHRHNPMFQVVLVLHNVCLLEITSTCTKVGIWDELFKHACVINTCSENINVVYFASLSFFLFDSVVINYRSLFIQGCSAIDAQPYAQFHDNIP